MKDNTMTPRRFPPRGLHTVLTFALRAMTDTDMESAADTDGAGSARGAGAVAWWRPARLTNGLPLLPLFLTPVFALAFALRALAETPA